MITATNPERPFGACVFYTFVVQNYSVAFQKSQLQSHYMRSLLVPSSITLLISGG